MGLKSNAHYKSLNVFNFSSETSERNTRKIDKKQDINMLYQVCVFQGDRKNKVATRAETFSTSPLKPLNGIQRNLTRSKISTCSTKCVFFGRSKKNKMAALVSLADAFRLLLWNRWSEFTVTWQEARSQRLYDFFGPIRKQKWRPWPIFQNKWRIVLTCTIYGLLGLLFKT